MSSATDTAASEQAIHVFVSYAREDRRWLDPNHQYSLVPFLAESLRRHNVSFWFDKELKPGDEFRRLIESEINQAQIALLIVSQSFLNSEFIETREMPLISTRAERGEMIVIPVLVGPCDWHEYPFLADRQMVPSSPLIEFTESEAKWAKIQYQILDGLKAQLHRVRQARAQHHRASQEKEESGPIAAGEVARPVTIVASRARAATKSPLFWGRSAWTWAGGVVSALLLFAIYAGVHQGWHGAMGPVPLQPGGAPAGQPGQAGGAQPIQTPQPDATPAPAASPEEPAPSAVSPSQASPAGPAPSPQDSNKVDAEGWYGFASSGPTADTDARLKAHCGPFQRVGVPGKVSSFDALCNSIGMKCVRTCDVSGNSMPCDWDPQRGPIFGLTPVAQSIVHVGYCSKQPNSSSP